MATRRQTIDYALTDSPAGLAAWMYDYNNGDPTAAIKSSQHGKCSSTLTDIRERIFEIELCLSKSDPFNEEEHAMTTQLRRSKKFSTPPRRTPQAAGTEELRGLLTANWTLSLRFLPLTGRLPIPSSCSL